jgi:hypothetical protein
MLRTLSILLQLRYALAKVQQGLPHEVQNVTTEALVSTPVTVNYTIAEPSTIVYTTTELCPSPTSTRSIYSIIFPSPNASPVEVTAQSQVVTSFIPEATWCVAPPMAIIAMTGPPYANGTANYTTTIEGTGSCETMYAPIETVSNTHT